MVVQTESFNVLAALLRFPQQGLGMSHLRFVLDHMLQSNAHHFIGAAEFSAA